jgi:hypothetical protein
VGEAVEVEGSGGFRLTVDELDGRRVARVRVSRPPEPADTGADGGADGSRADGGETVAHSPRAV